MCIAGPLVGDDATELAQPDCGVCDTIPGDAETGVPSRGGERKLDDATDGGRLTLEDFGVPQGVTQPGVEGDAVRL